ncbi:MAG: CPBP family intramembrane metalloprotease [Treponema sp.]|nr:CPBP family intramembrane metalloprotease [Treponema sp.]
MAPSFIGVIMVLATYDKEGKKEYFRRFYQVKRISICWWFFILLIFPAIHGITALIISISGAGMPGMELLQNPASLLFYLSVSLFSGPLPEEFGWRGFALQPLLDRLGFIKANLLLGTIWGVWHLPLFFMPGLYHYQLGFVGFWFFITHSIGLAMIMSLVFIKTRQSILSAILLHWLANLTATLMSPPASQIYERVEFLLVFVIGIVICLYMGKKKKSDPA